MAEYIEREAALRVLCDACGNAACPKGLIPRCSYYEKMQSIPAADVRPVPEGGIGEMSDGYHTFNGLYYQRMVLFAVLVRVYKDRAWKSWRHEDGELCFGKDNYFIVGIDTPQGSYTYHYHGEYWDLFDCVELPTAKHWDGHTEEDVTRLLSLDVRPVVLCKDCYAYRRDNELAEAAYLDPEMYCGLLRCEMGEDSFCSYGKRKEET